MDRRTRYEQQRRENGETKVAVWVPKGGRDKLINFAKSLRDGGSSLQSSQTIGRMNFTGANVWAYIKVDRRNGRMQHLIRRIGGRFIKQSSNPLKHRTWQIEEGAAIAAGIESLIQWRD